MNSPIYLDYSAATPVSDVVMTAAQPYFQERFYNPSARYLLAKAVRDDLRHARASIGQQLGVKADEVFFTAGGTEANNLAVHGVMQQYPGKRCVISAIEHDAIYQPAHEYDCAVASINDAGVVDVAALEGLIDDDTVLVSVMYANSEIGTIQPLRAIVGVLQQVRRDREQRGVVLPLIFHTDACQAPNHLDVQVTNLGVDMLTLNGGKIYGFKQSGCLYVNRHIKLKHIMHGGGQERGVRSGTENVAHAVGLAVALEQAVQKRTTLTKHISELQQYFMRELEQLGGVINGSSKRRIANNVNAAFPGASNERLMMQLDMAGIIVATGSACHASILSEPSRVLTALGVDEDQARSSLRFSMGRDTTKEQLQAVVNRLREFYRGKQ